MNKIIIFGDSWSKGTWKPVEHGQMEVDKPGLQLLSKKYKISNFSRGGAGNWESLISIFNYFEQFGINEHDIILLCQSDLFRDKGSETFDVNYQYFYKNSNNLTEFYNSLCEVFYYKINNIVSKFNKKIYLIGGLSDVDTKMLSAITNQAEVISSSWIKLFDDQHVESRIPLKIDKNFMSVATKNGRKDLAMESFDISQENFIRFTDLQSTAYMSNFIGDWHPTEVGHDVMARTILKYFEDTE